MPDDNLAFDPAPELEVLRRDHRRFEEVPLDGTSTGMLEGIRGDSLEIQAEFQVDGGAIAPLGLKLRRSPGGEEETRLFYDPVSESLVLDHPEVEPTPGPGPAAARGAVGPGPGRDPDSQGLPGPLGDRGVRQQDGLHHRADIPVPLR